MLFKLVLGLLSLCLAISPALSFEPPAFRLSEAQLKAYQAYGKEQGEKAFAAGPGGPFSAQAGYASATVAVREALKDCDKDITDAALRCLIIDLNGTQVPIALQFAQASRADPARLTKPVSVRDLTFDADAWAAFDGLGQKPQHKSFAMSLKGPWARSWEASSSEEADKEALAACNKNERAKTAPCFIVARDRERFDPKEFTAARDLSVTRQMPQ